MSITKQDYFDRRVNMLTEIETIKADLKQLQEDAAYDEDSNPKGLDKVSIKRINKASALEVAAKFEEYQEDVEGVIETYVELTGYNS